MVCFTVAIPLSNDHRQFNMLAECEQLTFGSSEKFKVPAMTPVSEPKSFLVRGRCCDALVWINLVFGILVLNEVAARFQPNENLQP